MFYTYAYLREDKTPYYIGKGSGKRVFVPHKGRNGKIVISVPSEERILILKENLTEEEAFKHEVYMINVLGRKDNNTGILRNQSNGGEGSSGHVKSEETISKRVSKTKGRKQSDEERQKRSEARKGIKFSEEHLENLRKAQQRRWTKN